MNKRMILLDAGPLGLASHPKARADFIVWFDAALKSGHRFVIPEIADYEVRRELLRAGKSKGLSRLDALRASFDFLPITSNAMLQAAEFWAAARKAGLPTAADVSLDADAILAGQAALAWADSFETIVATTNPEHLQRFVRAEHWSAIS